MKKNKAPQEQLSLFSQNSDVEASSLDQKSTIKKLSHWTIFIDGASRGNPGLSGAGIYGIDDEGEIIIKESLFLGTKTNNQAEYLALVFALYHIKKLLEKRALSTIKISFVSDSLLLVQQMKGLYKVKNPILKQMKTIIETLLIPMHHSFKHVLREYNLQADALANIGIDKKRKIPHEIVQFATLYNIPL